ncbi:MAG: hypothetical protein FWB90_05300 [Fibromonadales bacterium]|nr:hypothetical protein [Fibromonadales bacterium]
MGNIAQCIEAAKANVPEGKAREYEMGISKDEAKTRLFSQIRCNGGRIAIKNRDGIERYINKNSARKIINSIRGSTAKNGFTEKQHYAAAADIVFLYENSTKVLNHPDYKKRSKVESINRFVAPLYGDTCAFITGKVIADQGRKIHSLELTGIGKLEGTIGAAKKPNSIPATSSPLTI